MQSKDLKDCIDRALEKLQKRDPAELRVQMSGRAIEASLNWHRYREGQQIAIAKISKRRYR